MPSPPGYEASQTRFTRDVSHNVPNTSPRRDTLVTVTSQRVPPACAQDYHKTTQAQEGVQRVWVVEGCREARAGGEPVCHPDRHDERHDRHDHHDHHDHHEHHEPDQHHEGQHNEEAHEHYEQEHEQEHEHDDQHDDECDAGQQGPPPPP
ncbi:hypothetical protein C0992_005360 [Termitomyces sp. T32_za158]|nr:hypothetical protein C0992_005360 [Termitomyces sp. T32_za158]